MLRGPDNDGVDFLAQIEAAAQDRDYEALADIEIAMGRAMGDMVRTLREAAAAAGQQA